MTCSSVCTCSSSEVYIPGATRDILKRLSVNPCDAGKLISTDTLFHHWSIKHRVPWNWHRFISSLLPQIKYFLRDVGGDSWDFKSGSSLWMNHDISWYIVNLKCGRLDRILWKTMNYDIVKSGWFNLLTEIPSQSPSPKSWKPPEFSPPLSCPSWRRWRSEFPAAVQPKLWAMNFFRDL